MTRWIRAPALSALEGRDRLLLVAPDGAVRQLTGDSAALAGAVLAFLAAPRTRDEVLAHVTELAAAPPERPEIVDELLALLGATGAARPAVEAARAPRPSVPAGLRLVYGVTGAIGTLHAPFHIAALQRRGFDVRVVATRAALRFSSIAGLEAVTHRRVVRRMWSRDPRAPVPHLELAAWADLFVVCPASATTLSRLAAGSFRDVLAAAALTTRVPVVLAPSMNPAMWAAPAVERNLAQLRADGFYILPPALGIEVADAPARRDLHLGMAPPAETLADVLVALVRALGIRPRAAESPIDWEAIHAAEPAPDDGVDADLAAALDEHARPPATLLDVGTGHGAFAIHAARRGFQVVATDLSPTALERARVRAADVPVVWLRDDIADSRLHGVFHVAVDRGCLHYLPAVAHPRWASAVVRLVAPGGLLFVQCDAPAAPADRGTHRFTPATLTKLLEPAFAPVAARPSSFPSLRGPVPATLVILRRR